MNLEDAAKLLADVARQGVAAALDHLEPALAPVIADFNDGKINLAQAIDNPFPPFAFGSGLAWVAVPRDEAISLGLVSP